MPDSLEQNPLQVIGDPGETEEQGIARYVLGPEYQSALTLHGYYRMPTLRISADI